VLVANSGNVAILDGVSGIILAALDGDIVFASTSTFGGCDGGCDDDGLISSGCR